MPRSFTAEPFARLCLAAAAACTAWLAVLWSAARLPYLATCLNPEPGLSAAIGHCPLCWAAAGLALAAALPWPKKRRGLATS